MYIFGNLRNLRRLKIFRYVLYSSFIIFVVVSCRYYCYFIHNSNIFRHRFVCYRFIHPNIEAQPAILKCKINNSLLKKIKKIVSFEKFCIFLTKLHYEFTLLRKFLVCAADGTTRKETHNLFTKSQHLSQDFEDQTT